MASPICLTILEAPFRRHDCSVGLNGSVSAAGVFKKPPPETKNPRCSWRGFSGTNKRTSDAKGALPSRRAQKPEPQTSARWNHPSPCQTPNFPVRSVSIRIGHDICNTKISVAFSLMPPASAKLKRTGKADRPADSHRGNGARLGTCKLAQERAVQPAPSSQNRYAPTGQERGALCKTVPPKPRVCAHCDPL